MNKESEKRQETYFLLASTRGVLVFWASTPGVFEEGPGCQPPQSVYLHGGGWDGLQEDTEGSKKTEEGGVHLGGVHMAVSRALAHQGGQPMVQGSPSAPLVLSAGPRGPQGRQSWNASSD